jgi:elongation factor Ts
MTTPNERKKRTMANYTMADVKRLRDLTAAGFMDCKKALEESDGDFDKAVEILRIQGAKDVGKRAERTTANGLVFADGGVMVELNCETDFVAKNADFQQLADRIVAVAKQVQPADVEALKAAELDGKPVGETVQEFSARIGEKLELRRVVFFDGTVASYLHRRASDLPPAVGVLVEFTGDDAEAARGAAMQIAAMKPRYVTRAEVPEDVLANERRIAEQTAREEGKPEQALPKIVEGRVNGFFKDVVLLEQASVQEAKKTVKAVLDEAGVSVTRFARFEVGQA